MALTDSLISYWKLDEASGNALDAHGANDLTDNNTVGSAAGIIGNARSFAKASSEYFSLADNADLSTGDIDFTFAAWVKATSLTSQGRILCKSNSAATALEHQLFYSNTGSSFRFEVFSGSSAKGSVVWSAAASTATWYYVVAWHDSVNNEVGISVNDGTPVTSATTGAPADSVSPFAIGSLSGLANTFWDGLIDEVGFWKRVLTSQERTDLYNSGAGLSYDSFAGGGPTYTLTAANGSYTLTGQAASLKFNRKLTAAAGSYTLTGQAASLKFNRVLNAAAGSYSLTGNDATLTYTPNGGPTYTLAAGAGTYTLTGQAVAFGRNYVLSAGVGSYTLTGNAVRFSYSGAPVWAPVDAASGTWTAAGAAAGSWSPVN